MCLAGSFVLNIKLAFAAVWPIFYFLLMNNEYEQKQFFTHSRDIVCFVLFFYKSVHCFFTHAVSSFAYITQRGMENLALLAVQAQNVISSGNAILNATQFVLNQTRDFFVHGVLPSAGLDELDNFLLKKIGMLAHCGFENDMKITTGNVTEQLMCAMRVHLMNESEVHVFCPKEARVWEDSCTNVEFLNYTAISEPNELNVVSALRNSMHGLLASYPTSLEEDMRIIRDVEAGVATEVGPIMAAAVKLRAREKDILYSALGFLDAHEAAVRNGTVPFQLAMKAQERVEADIREAEHKLFMEQIKARALLRPSLATVPVDLGGDKPKANLTLEEGRDLYTVVKEFCKQHNIAAEYHGKLEKVLRERVVSPTPLLLMMGAVIGTGERKILAIPEGANSTIETGKIHTFVFPIDHLIFSYTIRGLSSIWIDFIQYVLQILFFIFTILFCSFVQVCSVPSMTAPKPRWTATGARRSCGAWTSG